MEGNYFPTTGESLDRLHVGIKAGFGFFSSTLTTPAATVNQSETDFAFGPQVGYDYPLGGGLSLGAEANYLIIATSTTIASGNTNVLNLLGAIKLWF